MLDALVEYPERALALDESLEQPYSAQPDGIVVELDAANVNDVEVYDPPHIWEESPAGSRS